MTETRTTILLGVPTMCIAPASRALGLSGCRRFGSPRRGAAFRVEVARDFERVFGGEVTRG